MALLSKLHPVVLKAGTTKASNILEGYAAFWKIPYQLNILNAVQSIIFTSDRATAFQSPTNHSVILTPGGREEAEKAASDAGAGVSSGKRLVRLPVRRGITVSMKANVYEYSGSRIEPLLLSKRIPILSRVHGTNVHLLGIDLVGEYTRLVHDGFEQVPSRRFSLVSKLPFSYQSIPAFIRNRSFRSEKGLSELTEENLRSEERRVGEEGRLRGWMEWGVI